MIDEFASITVPHANSAEAHTLSPPPISYPGRKVYTQGYFSSNQLIPIDNSSHIQLSPETPPENHRLEVPSVAVSSLKDHLQHHTERPQSQPVLSTTSRHHSSSFTPPASHKRDGESDVDTGSSWYSKAVDVISTGQPYSSPPSTSVETHPTNLQSSYYARRHNMCPLSQNSLPHDAHFSHRNTFSDSRSHSFNGSEFKGHYVESDRHSQGHIRHVNGGNAFEDNGYDSKGFPYSNNNQGSSHSDYSGSRNESRIASFGPGHALYNRTSRMSTESSELCRRSDSVESMDMMKDPNVKYEDSDFSNTGDDSYYRTISPGSDLNHYTAHRSHGDNNDSHGYYRHSMLTPPKTCHFPSSRSSTSSTPTALSPEGNYMHGGHYGQDEEKPNISKPKTTKQPRGAQNLPPCRVCGNKASGLHFGVNTCEACNEFFRRSLKRGASYYCTKNRDCQVYGKRRNACSFCRYRRCVEMGMSRDAIKTGRYSHKTRTEYAKEVEEVKLREMCRSEREKFEVLLENLVSTHDKYVCTTTRVSDEELLRRQMEYLDLYNRDLEHNSRHPPLSTAIRLKQQLNDCKEDISLICHDVEMTEAWLRNYINFAKNIPGFKELALSDQASLVRGTWFEFWFLGAFRGYNSSLRVVTYPNRRCFHEKEIIKIFGTEYTDYSFHISDRMRSLKVTPEEMVLIKTVCLTFPDRTPLENKEAVERMHWLMVSCLLHILEKNRPGDHVIFPLIVSKLVELRTLTEIAFRAHRSALFQDVMKESPLLSEMVDTKTRYVSSKCNGEQFDHSD